MQIEWRDPPLDRVWLIADEAPSDAPLVTRPIDVIVATGEPPDPHAADVTENHSADPFAGLSIRRYANETRARTRDASFRTGADVDSVIILTGRGAGLTAPGPQ